MVKPAFVAFAVISAATGLPGLHRAPESGDWRAVSASYAAVRDYTALYEKEEQAISGGEPQRMHLSFRRPLDVRLEWVDDSGKASQIAVYREGHNGGRLLARRSGVFGSLVGTVSLDPHDRRALADSRHPITDVGIGHIIESASRALAANGGIGRPVVEDTLDRQPAYRFEFVAPPPGLLFGIPGARRALVWVDRALMLPVSVEIVDERGAMLERHRFRDVHLNNGLTDSVFSL